MTNDERESSQEMTTRDSVGIPLSSTLGALLVRVLGGSADQVGGIAEDWLLDKRRTIRLERAERLARETYEALRARGVDSPTRPVPLNVALRIVEAATLEDDNFLQDHWARLLATAMDPNVLQIKRSFIGILKEFEPSDARLLEIFYQITLREEAPPFGHLIADGFSFDLTDMNALLEMDAEECEISLHNLDRSGCIALAMPGGRRPNKRQFHIILTALGKALVEACMEASATLTSTAQPSS